MDSSLISTNSGRCQSGTLAHMNIMIARSDTTIQTVLQSVSHYLKLLRFSIIQIYMTVAILLALRYQYVYREKRKPYSHCGSATAR